jgi:hypothetical protein
VSYATACRDHEQALEALREACARDGQAEPRGDGRGD